MSDVFDYRVPNPTGVRMCCRKCGKVEVFGPGVIIIQTGYDSRLWCPACQKSERQTGGK
jgi:hypothetical protein